MSYTTQIHTFKDDSDLGFYILNAVCHDWIHDFNNYKRMSKILNYIMELINQVGSIVKSERDSLSLFAKEIDSDIKILDNMDTPKSTNSEAKGKAEGKVEAKGKAEVKDTVVGKAEAKGTVGKAESKAVDTAKVKGTLVEKAEDKEETENDELFNAQSEKYSIDEEDIQVITPEELLTANNINTNQNIVLKSKHLYNNLHIKSRISDRINKERIMALQELEEFTNEAKFLVISRLNYGNMNVRHGGSSTPQKGGASAIDIITKDDISSSINGIINEIDDTQDVSTEDKKNLKNIFELMNQVFLNVNIPGISELEILNNSLISEILSMFIVNKCENIDIEKEAIIYLDALGVSKLNDIKLPTEAPSKKKFMMSRMYPTGRHPIKVGGKINSTIYRENDDKWGNLETAIDVIKSSQLYSIYKGEGIVINTKKKLSELHTIYVDFIKPLTETVKLIVGTTMFGVKTKLIDNAYTRALSTQPGSRLLIKYIQETIDSINDLLFDNIIKEYEDFKNRNEARFVTNSSSSKESLSPEERVYVQQISKLIADKTLELTGLSMYPGNNNDLKKQIEIINSVIVTNKGYTTVDERLLSYFIETYESKPVKTSKGKASTTNETMPTFVVLTNNEANEFLVNSINNAENHNCRVINNAIPEGDIKDLITGKKLVVCPTSSVCDGMGSFGSCLSPPTSRQEYHNMDFMISDTGNNNFYQGATYIKDNRQVTINYGIKYNGLELYNFLTINLESQPIVLQANYTFKHVINRIIEIWKSASGVTNITELWSMLYDTDYFLSILKLGSQKAVGDIFQEVNSTLYNCGYGDLFTYKITKASKEYIYNVNENVKTYGLMGDRPSGIRVFKLLLNGADNSIMPLACGGYIGTPDNMLIYVPNILIDGKKKGGKKTHRHNKKISRNNRMKHNKRTHRNRKTRKS